MEDQIFSIWPFRAYFIQMSDIIFLVVHNSVKKSSDQLFRTSLLPVAPHAHHYLIHRQSWLRDSLRPLPRIPC